MVDIFKRQNNLVRTSKRPAPRLPAIALAKAGSSKSVEGFTLTELVVAIGIFSILLIIVAGVFSRFVMLERHSIAQSSLVLDVQSAFESFIKEARTGYGSTYSLTYEAGKVEKIAFRNQKGLCVSYRRNEITVDRKKRGIFERAENPTSLSGNCDSEQFGDNVYLPLTSDATNVSDVFFDVTPSIPGAEPFSLENQGIITLTMTARSMKTDIPAIKLQNTVTSRQVIPYVPPS